MRCYIDKDKKMIFEISRVEKKTVKAVIRGFEAGISYASNLSKDDQESKLAKYVAATFLDDESKRVAQYSYFNFIYQLKEKLGLH